MIDFQQSRSIHIIGVAGSVMGGIACLLKEQGHEVRGSDRDCYPPMSDRLANAGVNVILGFAEENITEESPELVLVGNITRRTNPEAVAMRRLGLPHISLPELLSDMFLSQRRSITVAGTHGKTTTTSILVWLLKQAGLDPGYMIGGVPIGFESGLSAGTGPHFVLEADEYDTAYFDKRPKFVHYRPRIGILTSVEFDHADIYRDFDAVRRAFRTYSALFNPNDQLWVHGADEEARAAASYGPARICLYGIEGDANNLDAFATDVRLANQADRTRFRLIYEGRDLGFFELPQPGRHNVWNAVAAISIAVSEGADVEALRAALPVFPGVRRRQELQGEPRGIRVLQDYAHHPTAVRETIAAIRTQFPERRLWALFEAESNTSRRRLFQKTYVDSFHGSDEVIFVRPLEKDDGLPVEECLDADLLAADLRENGIHARFIPDADTILKVLEAEVRSGDVVLFMSGRNFLGLPLRLVERLQD